MRLEAEAVRDAGRVGSTDCAPGCYFFPVPFSVEQLLNDYGLLAIPASAFGAEGWNGSILTSVRVPYAMARDGVMFPFLGRVHPRTHSPVNALAAIGVITCLIILLVPGFNFVLLGELQAEALVLRMQDLKVSESEYAAWLAARIGLIRTMVVTHLPSNVLLMLVPLMPTVTSATWACSSRAVQKSVALETTRPPASGLPKQELSWSISPHGAPAT